MPAPPELPAPSPHELAHRRQNMLGCGLAAYAFVLLGIFAAGVAGLSIATYTLFSAGEAASPMNLSYGGLTSPVFLEPLEAAGLLPAGAAPDAYHAEALDGSVACALYAGELLRLSPEGAFRMPLSTVSVVEEVPEGVRVVGEREVLCRFNAGEGADRFARMLRAATRTAR